MVGSLKIEEVQFRYSVDILFRRRESLMLITFKNASQKHIIVFRPKMAP
jgi:predicted transposase YdaD